jgi:NADH-quinone oxidoreductase subunit N
LFEPVNFTIAAPLLALAAGALVILLLDLLLPAEAANPWWYAAGLGAIGVAGYYLSLIWGKGLTGFNGAMVMDQLSVVFTVILLGAAFMTILLSFSRGEEDKSGYLALILWAGMGMILMASANNLMMIFLGIELLSLALYVAVAFDPLRANAREAALKYFVLGSVASAFILFGFALIYGVTGTMELPKMAALAGKDALVYGALYYKVGIGLAIVGFAFKMGLVPFHSWVPDVYQGAPTPVTAYMSVGTKAAAFAVTARFLINVVPVQKQGAFLLPLAVFAAASMILGATVGIWQTDLKRLMAYSGIAHAGYLIMAIPGLGASGLSAAAYYLAAYGFTAFGVFAIITLLEVEGREGSALASFEGLWYERPYLAVAMSIFMFGLAGLPPTGGFIGKFLLARAAVGSSSWLLLTALVVSTGISAYVYLRVIGAMIRKPELASVASVRRKAVMAGGQPEALELSPSAVHYGMYVVILLAVVGSVWLGVLPGGAGALLRVAIGI